MPILALLILVLQITFVVHAVRNGKDWLWILLIILVPVLGCAVYFFTQILPDAANSGTARRAGRGLVKAVDPQRELRKRRDQLALADTAENRIALAEECIEAHLYADAVEILEGALVGVHKEDPAILELLGRTRFLDGDSAGAVATLDALIAAHPNFRSPDGHLLYAQALEAMGRVDAARGEYEVLSRSYPGEEARVRYALLLKRLGETEHAARLFEETLVRSRRAPGYYRKKEREWIRLAEQG